jgi:hypothetical protein
MALTITPDNFIDPEGELTINMFPDGDIESRVATWIEGAARKTANDDIAMHWVYYRAYNSISNRLAATPSSEGNFGNHQIAWSGDRVKSFRDLAASHLADYARLSGDYSLTPDAVPVTDFVSLKVY